MNRGDYEDDYFVSLHFVHHKSVEHMYDANANSSASSLGFTTTCTDDRVRADAHLCHGVIAILNTTIHCIHIK